MKCRCCESEATQIFVDLGNQPPSNAYLTESNLDAPEQTFPLTVYVCHECWLVQLPTHANFDELFTETYAYFSSVSSTWVEHARRYVDDVVKRFELGSDSLVVEVASNDGYLLQFVQAQGIPCLGIEPTTSTATAAREKGIETVEEFFGRDFSNSLVSKRGNADLLIGNNVLAHVPDLNDFVAGVAIALSPDGVATFEFPHLMQLVRGMQFDTIYHEHYSYLSLFTVARLFASHGMRVFDVEQLSTHGGSLRVFATSSASMRHPKTPRVDQLLKLESAEGMQTEVYYANFQMPVERIKQDLLAFLRSIKQQGKKVCGYGAAAKGNTLMNFSGISSELVPFVCDAAPSKQGKYLPGSRIPIVSPDVLASFAPDHVVIFPWNIADEIVEQQTPQLPASVQFHVAIPHMKTIQASVSPIPITHSEFSSKPTKERV